MNNKPLSIFSFPIWWYSEGLSLAWKHCQSRWRYVLRSTGFVIFLRNIAQPLYGDTTRQGKIISVFIRLVLLVFIFFWTGIRLAFPFFLFVIHVLALPLAIVMIVYQLFSLV
jgi:hypothetical protein